MLSVKWLRKDDGPTDRFAFAKVKDVDCMEDYWVSDMKTRKHREQCHVRV